MKSTFKNKLIILLFALASLFIFSGCTLKDTVDDVLNEYDLVAQVTYYSNGGSFEQEGKEKNYYCKEGTKALPIGFLPPEDKISGSMPKITRDGYELTGWYFVELADGKPVFEDEEKGIYKLAEAVDFSVPLQKGDVWMIAAKWKKLSSVKVMMVCDDGETVEIDQRKGAVKEDVVSFKNGDEIGELIFDDNGKVSLAGEPDSKLFTVKDKAFTFISYYEDAACQTRLDKKTVLTQGDNDIVVYAKYAKGEWTRISNSLEFRSIFSSSRCTKNYWVMNDIDCKNTQVTPLTELSGKIQGNGYTISNFKIYKEKIVEESVAIFGNIKEGASITDITFSGVTMEYKSITEPAPKVYGIFSSVAAAATISNVTFSGTLQYSGKAATSTLTGELTNCLFGGFTVDSEYTGDITVSVTVKLTDGDRVVTHTPIN